MQSSIETDKQAIREIVENWVIFSDSGNWERFAECWHDDGFMAATYVQATASDFINARKEVFNKDICILHTVNAFTCDVVGDRAISQTKMTISQRATVHDILVDVVCFGRFYDFFERRDGRWGMVRRQPIYERDRMDPVDPAATLTLDPDVLASFPESYRYLGYLQQHIGYPVKKTGMPSWKGPEVERVYREGQEWLNGSEFPGRPD